MLVSVTWTVAWVLVQALVGSIESWALRPMTGGTPLTRMHGLSIAGSTNAAGAVPVRLTTQEPRSEARTFRWSVASPPAGIVHGPVQVSVWPELDGSVVVRPELDDGTLLKPVGRV